MMNTEVELLSHSTRAVNMASVRSQKSRAHIFDEMEEACDLEHAEEMLSLSSKGESKS